MQKYVFLSLSTQILISHEIFSVNLIKRSGMRSNESVVISIKHLKVDILK